jgi:large subunit ribosomal protein L28
MFPSLSSKASRVAPRMRMPTTLAALGAYFPSTTPSPTADQQVRHRSNRSRRGLYDGKDIRTGNNVSFSMRATKRTFKPNVFIKRVYSEILDDMVQFHLTTSTLRSIDKAGGLDNYLLKNEFTEGEGHKIKKNILKRLKNQAYFERKAAEHVGDSNLSSTASTQADG